MKKEIRDFYVEKDLHISKLIERGKVKNLNKAQIEEAAVLVYKRIQSGEEMKTIKMAWEVWRVAKRLEGKEFAKEDLTIKGLEGSLQKRKLYEVIAANILIWGTVIYEIWRLIYGR